MGKRKAPDDETLRNLFASGLSDSEIARGLGLAVSTVRRNRYRLGIPANRPVMTQIKVDRGAVHRGTLEGMSARQLAEKLNCNISTVNKIRTELGIASLVNRNPVKYDPEHVRELHVAGYTETRISQEMGCPVRTVQRIKKRLGLTTPRRELEPLEDRLQMAEEMLNDGAPFSLIMESLHISEETLRKYFPGRAWSRDQVIEWAVAHRNANRMYRKLGV